MRELMYQALLAASALVASVIYLLPSLWALVRREPKWGMVVFLNVLLGWTGLGWLAAFWIAVGRAEWRGPPFWVSKSAVVQERS